MQARVGKTERCPRVKQQSKTKAAPSPSDDFRPFLIIIAYAIGERKGGRKLGIGKTGKEQTKLELLESYRYFVADYESAEYMVEKWKAKLENMAGSPGDCEMFSGGLLPADRVAEYVEIWNDIVGRYLERMKLLKEKMAMCEQICDELPEKYGAIMRMKYLRLMTWRQVGEELHFSEEWMREMGDQAKHFLKEPRKTPPQT